MSGDALRFRYLERSDARRLPWRNGKGTTEELAIAPAGARFEDLDFVWRLARAPIVESGPFSDFSGYERLLVPVEVEARHRDAVVLELDHDGGAPRGLKLGQVHAFSGAAKTSCRLRHGPVVDLNVLYKSEVCAAALAYHESRSESEAPLDLELELAAREDLVVVALADSIELRDLTADALPILGGDAVWIEGPSEKRTTPPRIRVTARHPFVTARFVELPVSHH